MTQRHPHTGRPRSAFSALEWRALLEMAALPWSLPLLATAPRGDGHPVLLLPGFMASEVLADRAEAVPAQPRLRGRRPGAWGATSASTPSTPTRSSRRSATCTTRPAARSAWSAGAWAACSRSTARTRPASACAASSRWAARSASIRRAAQSPPLREGAVPADRPPDGPAAHAMQPRAKKLRERKTLPVPMSCLYSLSDGVVPPQEATIDGDPALHENIRVPGSHVGLGFNADGAVDRRRPAGAARRRRGGRSSRPGRWAVRPDALARADVARAALGLSGCAARASARYSWKLSRTHCVNTCGSGISSRHEVGETTIRPS